MRLGRYGKTHYYKPLPSWKKLKRSAISVLVERRVESRMTIKYLTPDKLIAYEYQLVFEPCTIELQGRFYNLPRSAQFVSSEVCMAHPMGSRFNQIIKL